MNRFDWITQKHIIDYYKAVREIPPEQLMSMYDLKIISTLTVFDALGLDLYNEVKEMKKERDSQRSL